MHTEENELYPNSAYDADRDVKRVFDSIEEFNAYLDTIPKHLISNDYDADFYGKSFDESRKVLKNGDLACAAQAEKIFAQFADTTIFTHNASIIGSDVVGFTPIIPAALMGHPHSMLVRQQVERESASTPINIYVETTVSAGVNEKQLFNRGSAALALCMALGMKRPTTLYAVAGVMNTPHNRKKTALLQVKVCDNVLDLSRAAFILTSREFARRLMFSTVAEITNRRIDSLPWPFGLTPQSANYDISMRHAFGAQPDDIYIKGGFLLDKLALTDPVAWVKLMIEKHSPDAQQE